MEISHLHSGSVAGAIEAFSCDDVVDGVVVCSQSSVILLKMRPLQEQVPFLFVCNAQINLLISDEYKNFDDALTLCNLFPRGKEMIRDQFKTQIARLKGLYLFSEGKYDKAISFLQRDQVPTRQVLSLYPSIIPDDLPTDMCTMPCVDEVQIALSEACVRFANGGKRGDRRAASASQHAKTAIIGRYSFFYRFIQRSNCNNSRV